MLNDHWATLRLPTPRLWLWLAVLVAASVGFSLAFACAVPLAAFGAIAALTLRRGQATGLMLGVWLANQIVGFAVLGYPLSASALGWSPILAIVGIASALAARPLVRGMRRTPALAWPACFAASFVIYEGGLYVISAGWMGGVELYTAPVVERIAALNAVAFVGLAALDRLVRDYRVALLPPRSVSV